MLKKWFKWGTRNEWIITIKNGEMVRQCERTGTVQYRDCANQVWLSPEDFIELNLPRRANRKLVSVVGYSVEIDE